MKRVLAPIALCMFVAVTFFAGASSASAGTVIGSAGSGAGQYSNPLGIAVDSANGRLYVADAGNNRIDVFDDSSGAFLFAFGWNVNAASPEQTLQTCTSETGCQKGTAGSGAGQFNAPEKIAVDSASHSVYVSENSNHRVQKLAADGSFQWMVGGEVDQVTHANLCTLPANCGAGIVGAGDGEFLTTLSRSANCECGRRHHLCS